MKSTMVIKAEFMAGTNIDDAIEEAKLKAGLLNVAYIDFNFNGVNMSIGRNCCIKTAVDEFHRELNSSKKHKMVCFA